MSEVPQMADEMQVETGTGAAEDEPMFGEAPPEGAIFNAEEYADPALVIEKPDGLDVGELILTFSGTVKLDRKNPDHCRIVRECKLGGPALTGAGITGLSGIVLSKKPSVKLDEGGDVRLVTLAVGVQIMDIAFDHVVEGEDDA